MTPEGITETAIYAVIDRALKRHKRSMEDLVGLLFFVLRFRYNVQCCRFTFNGCHPLMHVGMIEHGRMALMVGHGWVNN